MDKTVLEQIQENVRGQALANESMKEHTTIQVGGLADLLVYPADREDLATLLALLAEHEVPYIILGNGSNLVVRDGGIRGAVINLSEGFRLLERVEDVEGSPRIRVDAGVALRILVRWSVDQGIAGLADLAGIPATVGGALAMNAGAWGVAIGDRVEELLVMDRDGDVRSLSREELGFGYRSVELPPDAIILQAVLSGTQSTMEDVKEQAKAAYRRRKETQPLADPSAGCVFRNPSGSHAGKMIDGCGLKGVRVGDAQVSPVHANFIVNVGRATAGHVISLIGMIQERVYVKHRTKLSPEVRIVGEWEKSKLRIQD